MLHFMIAYTPAEHTDNHPSNASRRMRSVASSASQTRSGGQISNCQFANLSLLSSFPKALLPVSVSHRHHHARHVLLRGVSHSMSSFSLYITVSHPILSLAASSPSVARSRRSGSRLILSASSPRPRRSARTSRTRSPSSSASRLTMDKTLMAQGRRWRSGCLASCCWELPEFTPVRQSTSSMTAQMSCTRFVWSVNLVPLPSTLLILIPMISAPLMFFGMKSRITTSSGLQTEPGRCPSRAAPRFSRSHHPYRPTIP